MADQVWGYKDGVNKFVEESNGGFSPSRSVGQASFEAHNIAVAGASFEHVSWVFAQGDAALVDLTDPALPVPVAAGVYAYVYVITQQAGGDGSPFYGVLVTDFDFFVVTVQDARLGLASSEYPESVLPMTATWFSTAGSAFQTSIGNGGAAGSDTFDALLYVQRIT